MLKAASSQSWRFCLRLSEWQVAAEVILCIANNDKTNLPSGIIRKSLQC